MKKAKKKQMFANIIKLSAELEMLSECLKHWKVQNSLNQS